MRAKLFRWSAIFFVVVMAIVFVRIFQHAPLWSKIEGQGLRRAHEHSQSILFISKDIGFLGRSHSGATLESLPEYEAVLYKTVDGGNSWARRNIANGEVKQIEFIDGVLYLLVQIYTENNLRNLRSAIFRSVDSGSHWEEVFATELPLHVRKIFPYSKSTLYALFGDQSNGHARHYVARSDDAGSSWEEIGPVENIRHFGHIFLQGQRMIFMGRGDNLEAYDLLAGKSDTIYELKNITNPIMTIDSKENIWLLGNSNDGMELLMIDPASNDRKISLGKKLGGGSPYSFHVEGDAISAFVTSGSSILGVSKKFFHSEDGGHTWKEEQTPFPLRTKPTFYYGPDHVWALTGGGDLQIRSPEE